MSDSSTIVASAPAGDAIDEDAITVGAVTVKRQRVRIGGLGAAELQDVRNAAPATTDYGGVVREARVGQATMAASFPVVLASDQGVVPTSVADGGSVTLGAKADAAWDGVAAGPSGMAVFKAVRNLLAGTLTVATHAVTQSGTWTQDVTDRAARLLGHVTVDNLPATQPVSGTVAVSGVTGNVDVTPAIPAANDYLPVRLTDGAAFYTAGAGGGGGGAVTVADGADVAQGTTTDAAWTTGAGTVVGLLKAVVGAIKATLTADITDRAARLLGHVTVDNASLTVTGTFWQATQPVSGTVTANQGTNPWTVQGNQGTRQTANITTATSVVGPFNVGNMNIATITVSGTYAGVSFIFEGTDDGTNWYTLQGTRTDTSLIETGAAAITNTLRAWDVPLGGLTQVRVRATAWTSGTAAIGVTMQAMPYEPSPAVGIANVGGNAVTTTLPVSGTVTGNQGTPNTAANAWPAKVTDGTNTAAVKAASTAAVAADPAAVASLSPNSPLIGLKPFTALGFYAVSGDTGTYSGLAANTPLFSFRWGDATRFAVILKVEVVVFTSVAASTAGITERQLIVARSFTASDTGGTALTPTLNNQKRRTSFGTSLATDIRIGNPITAGTRTLDTNPMARALGWSALNHTGPIIGGHGAGPTSAAWSTAGAEPIKLLDAADGQDYPIVLAQNEGIIVRIGVVMPTGATQETWINVVWGEVASY